MNLINTPKIVQIIPSMTLKDSINEVVEFCKKFGCDVHLEINGITKTITTSTNVKKCVANWYK